jgi:predicted ATPase
MRSLHPQPAKTGYKMIVSAEITNFRGFTSVQLSGLRTINIIVGDNGSGKTALLEALFIASAAGPDAAHRVRNWRSGSVGKGSVNPANAYTSLWGDFFPESDVKKLVRVRLRGSKDDSRKFEMFQAKEVAPLPLSELSDTGATGVVGEPFERPVTFRWEQPGEPPTEITPLFRGGNLIAPAYEVDTNINGALLVSRQPVFAQEIAQFYSDLRKRNGGAPFEKMMTAVFEQIEALSVEVEAGSAYIYAKTKDVPALQPLHLVSDGINRVASVLLNIAARPGGVVCIDEIDSGLYFARQQSFWKAVKKFAFDNGTELFASTHSLEALRALAPAMRESPEHFTLIRVYRHKGQSNVAMVSGEDGLALIESGLEVR